MMPPVLEFEAQGRKFVADITPCQEGGYCFKQAGFLPPQT